jgi:hypothetical protein
MIKPWLNPSSIAPAKWTEQAMQLKITKLKKSHSAYDENKILDAKSKLLSSTWFSITSTLLTATLTNIKHFLVARET